MTNDEPLTIAHAILIRCAETGQDCVEIEKAVNVLVRDRSDRPWRIARFSYINESLSVFACECEWRRQLAFYKGNESSVGKFSDIDFWYVKNGKPELVKGESK